MEGNAILFLGAYHGINPGMGWLFAVALGMQQGSARGVWRALPPIALGHAVAVGVVLLALGLLQMVVPLGVLKVMVASVLLAFGVYRLWRHRHPRFGGMQVGFRDLTVWSFLMASAHGAGFMVLPFVMDVSQHTCAEGGHHARHVLASGASLPWSGPLALTVHTLAYLLCPGSAGIGVGPFSVIECSALRAGIFKAWGSFDPMRVGSSAGGGVSRCRSSSR